MNQEMIHYSWKASIENDMIFRDATMQSLLLNSTGPQNTLPLSWLIKQQLLQKRQYFQRTNIFLKNLTNQAITEKAARLDPNYSLLYERGLLIRTQTLTSLAYHEALQRIQDEDSLALTQFRRNVDHTNSPPLEIHIDQDDTLEKGGSETTRKDEEKNDRSQGDQTHTFPCILHEILSNPEYSECITWLPHGRAWRIIRRAQFGRVVIPRHFRHGRYSSFMRQVNGWGFQRITAGPDHNAYHHELFRKDSPHLCWKMRRPVSSDTPRSQVTMHRFSEMMRHRDC